MKDATCTKMEDMKDQKCSEWTKQLRTRLNLNKTEGAVCCSYKIPILDKTKRRRNKRCQEYLEAISRREPRVVEALLRELDNLRGGRWLLASHPQCNIMQV
mmetsp:Transcript_7887/g.19333  ORF Transcript_7887/g.19333 Transcript_7887/m.19333 type:complete len:101 (-) Transcript_7887:363-665(-)